MLAHTLAAVIACVTPAIAVAAPPPAYTMPLTERWKAALPDTTLGQAAGFFYARNALAERMMAAQPELKPDVAGAQMSFRAQYEPGFKAIMSELSRREPAFAQEWEKTVKPAMDKQFEGKSWTKAEVENALKNGTFNPRAQSGTERSVLCAMNPAYVEKPFHEFNEGYVTVSYAGIQGDDAHRGQVTHPVSWGRVDTGGKSLVLAGALGAGPLVFKLDLIKTDDTKGAKDGAALKALLDKYGPKPAAGVTFGEVQLSQDQTSVLRTVHSTSGVQSQTMRNIGMYTAMMKDDMLVMTLVSFAVPVDPANPTGDDQQIEALGARYKPVLAKVLESLLVQDAPPAAPAPNTPAPGR